MGTDPQSSLIFPRRAPEFNTLAGVGSSKLWLGWLADLQTFLDTILGNQAVGVGWMQLDNFLDSQLRCSGNLVMNRRVCVLHEANLHMDLQFSIVGRSVGGIGTEGSVLGCFAADLRP